MAAAIWLSMLKAQCLKLNMPCWLLSASEYFQHGLVARAGCFVSGLGAEVDRKAAALHKLDRVLATFQLKIAAEASIRHTNFAGFCYHFL